MTTRIHIELDEKRVRQIVLDYVARLMGDEVEYTEADVCLEVKSKQNHRSEWEQAEFRATIKKTQL